MVEYYSKDSDEKIEIRGADGEIRERLLAVEGMRKHDKDTLRRIKSRDIWDIDDLRKLESW